MGFVELTLNSNGRPVYISIAHIEAVTGDINGSTIWVTGGEDSKYLVRESYDEVKSAINVKMQGRK